MPSLIDIALILLGFLPQILVLYFCLLLIQDSGILNKFIKKFGLDPDFILPVCVSLSCTTLGICSACKKAGQKKNVMFLSLLPCSAQMPLMLLIISTVLKMHIWMVIFVYLFAILLAIMITSFFSKTNEEEYIIPLEDLKIKLPNIFRCFKQSILQTMIFMKKIFIAFTLSAFVIVILARFSFDFKQVYDVQQSILFSVCGAISWIFEPIGLGSPAIICALIFGLIAKESTVSVLLFFPNILQGLNFASGLSLLIFYVFYPKCLSAQAAVYNNCGGKVCKQIIIMNFLIAYLLAFVVYNLCVYIR